MEENRKLSLNEIEKVSGGNYCGPIPYDQIDEKALYLDDYRKIAGADQVFGLAMEYYYDREAAEICRTQGGAAWAEYVKAHYDPLAGRR